MSQKSKKKTAPNVKGRTPAQPKSPALSPPAAPARALSSMLDDAEPQASGATLPIWLIVLLFLLLYWGMLHLDRYSGGFNEFVFGPYHSYQQVADLAPKSGPEMMIAQGEAIYNTVCIACHQSTGLGLPGQFPPLAGSEWAEGPAERMIRIPLHGLTGPITIKGQSWNASMPALWGTPPINTDENLAAVLTYVRQAWGNKASPVTAEQVKAARLATASHTSAWTEDELKNVQ